MIVLRYDEPIWEFLLLRPSSIAAISLLALLLCAAVAYRKYLRMIVKSLGRNLRRTILSGLAIFVLVFVVTLIWSILWFLDLVTSEKSKDFKAIVGRSPSEYAAMCAGPALAA